MPRNIAHLKSAPLQSAQPRRYVPVLRLPRGANRTVAQTNRKTNRPYIARTAPRPNSDPQLNLSIGAHPPILTERRNTRHTSADDALSQPPAQHQMSHSARGSIETHPKSETRCPTHYDKRRPQQRLARTRDARNRTTANRPHIPIRANLACTPRPELNCTTEHAPPHYT
uniref:Uncharacterized protein n=1 Tax=Knipowitschia caucasica TaxID=637954 RepID=A0AAV2MJV4_KNICA